jgi:hypothetical protein
MTRTLRTALAVLALIALSISLLPWTPRAGAAAAPGITLVGKGTVPGAALDKSGLAGNICQAGVPSNCVPKAIFGGFGSDVTYTGHDNVFIAAPDRINRGQGVSEILAVNDHEFLVVERDNRSFLAAEPQAPTRKKIYKINLDGATDVSGIASLPAGALPAGVVPVGKTLFIDLLDPAFNLSPTIAEKIEGLSWGPDLADGRHLLYVISDNDLNPNLATQIYAFAIDPSLLDYEEQTLPGPLYPPGQVKKALK